MEKRQHRVGALCLLCAAVVWGFAFVAQDLGAAHVEGFTFQATRNAFASLLLFLVVLARDGVKKKRGSYQKPTREENRALLLGGLLCGVVLCVASSLQQFGIANNTTSPGKDAFITALYIVAVPILGLLVGRRSRFYVYLCVLGALVGLWLLCMSGEGISEGDLLVILCAVVYGVHILILDHFAPRTDGVKLALTQFVVVAIICTVMALIFEKPTFEAIYAARGAILFAGVCGTAMGYTLQILGQSRTPSTAASLIMSLESVFAMIASAIVLPEITRFTFREVAGMVLIFACVILAQIELPKKEKK